MISIRVAMYTAYTHGMTKKELVYLITVSEIYLIEIIANRLLVNVALEQSVLRSHPFSLQSSPPTLK